MTDNRTLVLLNGQGDFCENITERTYIPVGYRVPYGCFTMRVTMDEYELIRDGKARMLADGKLIKHN